MTWESKRQMPGLAWNYLRDTMPGIHMMLTGREHPQRIFTPNRTSFINWGPNGLSVACLTVLRGPWRVEEPQPSAREDCLWLGCFRRRKQHQSHESKPFHRNPEPDPSTWLPLSVNFTNQENMIAVTPLKKVYSTKMILIRHSPPCYSLAKSGNLCGR